MEQKRLRDCEVSQLFESDYEWGQSVSDSDGSVEEIIIPHAQKQRDFLFEYDDCELDRDGYLALQIDDELVVNPLSDEEQVSFSIFCPRLSNKNFLKKIL